MSVLIAGILFSGCNPLKKMKDNAGDVRYAVNPPILELVGDQVAVTVSGNYPAKYFNQNVILTLTPSLQAGSNERDLAEYKVQGEKVKENNRVIHFNNGGSFSQSWTIPYHPDFQRSELVLRISAARNAKSLDFDPVKLADGINTTVLLVERIGKPTYAADRYVRVTPDSYEADIKYAYQQSDVRTAETRKPEITAFTDAVRAAHADERVNFTGTEVSSFASPEGPFALNERLSTNRGRTGQDFFARSFRAARVDEVMQPSLLRTLNTPEDWDGFRRAVEASNLRDKDLIVRVLSMHNDPIIREREIRNMTAAFKELQDHVLPQLRRTRIVVNVERVGRSDQEINTQFDSDPSVLSVEELLYAGTLTQDNERKRRIYQAAATQYPNDFRTKNNLGVVLLHLNRVAEARTVLTEARTANDNELVKNNLAVVALREGNLAQAEELLNAAGSSDDVKFNLGTIKIIQGNYSEANTHFGNQVEVNAALAKLLVKNDDAALTTLNSVRRDEPIVSYLKAIVAARKQDNNGVMTNLRAAAANAELKARAPKDVEFLRYFDDATFRSIVQ
jgi:Flp pilus assembly protein TadD